METKVSQLNLELSEKCNVISSLNGDKESLRNRVDEIEKLLSNNEKNESDSLAKQKQLLDIKTKELEESINQQQKLKNREIDLQEEKRKNIKRNCSIEESNSKLPR